MKGRTECKIDEEIGSDNQWSSKLSYGGRGKQEEERGAAEGLAKGSRKAK